MRTTNPVEARVLAIIEPLAEPAGYRIVRIRLSGLRRKTLQIMAERLSDGLMNASDCSRLARAIGDALEEIEYENLEVSSPGIDRPLMRLEDFERFVGHEAKLETIQVVDNRKRYKGTLVGVEGEMIRLALDEGEVQLPFSGLHEARLVLTDKLIAEDLRRAKAADAEDARADVDEEGDVLSREGEVADEVGRRGRKHAPSPPPQSSLRDDSSPSRGSTSRATNGKRKLQ